MALTQPQQRSIIIWMSRLPTMVAGMVAAIIVVTTISSWPSRPTVPNEETTSGIVVAVRAAEVTGNTDLIIYGYRLPDDTQLFARVPIEPLAAHPGYSWFGISGGQDIRVAYNSAEPEQSIPYRTFPIWATFSWAVIVSALAFIVTRLFTKSIARMALLLRSAPQAP